MRARQVIIGLVGALGVASLVLPAAGSASPDPTSDATTSDPVASSEPSDTVAGAEAVPLPAARITGGPADRGAPVQLTPTLPPPPPTTTTTTIPGPVDSLELPAGSGTGRRVVYSLSTMRVWAVEADGTVVKTHRVSGKRGVPYPGTYSVWSRSLHTNSIENPAIRWMYMVRFAKSPNNGNIGFHEIPTQCRTWTSWTTGTGCWKLQTEAQLGQPLSGGCVRQATPDAIWIWEWAGLGTKVVVLA